MSAMRWSLLILTCASTLACAQTRPTTATASRATTHAVAAGPGQYRDEVRAKPAVHLHVITVDLTDPAVSVVVRPAGADPDGPAGPWATSLMTVRAVAARDDLAVAVNGDFFSPKDVREIFGRRVP